MADCVPFVQAVSIEVIDAAGVKKNVTLGQLEALDIPVKPVNLLTAAPTSRPPSGPTTTSLRRRRALRRRTPRRHQEKVLAAALVPAVDAAAAASKVPTLPDDLLRMIWAKL